MTITIRRTAGVAAVLRSAAGPLPVALLPVSLALLVLTAVGLFAPGLIDPGLGTAQLLAGILTVGPVAVVVLARAALRGRGWLRLSWGGLCLAAAFWTASLSAEVSGWDDRVVWLGLRGIAFLAICAGLLAAPGTRRTAQQWGLLLLDGWLVGASAFLVGWVALGATGSPLASPGAQSAPPVLAWVPFDLVIASVTTGLAVRTAPAVRLPVMLLVLASLLLVTADTTWALTGNPQFGVVQWVIMLFALGQAGLTRRLDVWAPARAEPERLEPKLHRLSQIAVVPGLIAAILPARDIVTMIAALSVILVLAVEMLLVTAQSQGLWRTMRRQAERLDQLIAESRDAIVQLDGDGAVEFANQAVAEVLGYPPDSLLGRRGIELIHPADRSEVVRRFAALGDVGVRVSARFRHGDGQWRHLESTVSRRTGGVPGYTLSARDVSERARLEVRLRQTADTDALTGLLARQAFLARLEDRLRTGKVAVLFIDLDGFKAVNDTSGHAAGDRLLREVASALRAGLRRGDLAARLGGDEFAVLCVDGGPDEAAALAHRLLTRLIRLQPEGTHPDGTLPGAIRTDVVRLAGASIGVATGRHSTAEALLGDADLAMYAAKAAGGGRVAVYEPGMRRLVLERARMRAALERAGDGTGLSLHVQPIVAMADGRWVGFEALTRWRDGDRIRLPGEFLPLAEETGLIVPIGSWVLRESLRWLAGWPDPAAGISVNVAGRQVAAAGFAEQVREELRASRVNPRRLTLEITEQTAVQDLDRTRAVLQPLRSLGVHVALDDFGTGFSSLGYLATLPVDELKIDRRFVAGVGRRAPDDALVRAVIGLADELGLRVVAEGVETEEQARLLLERGCGLAQGFRFQPPVPIGSLPPPPVEPVASAAG